MTARFLPADPRRQTYFNAGIWGRVTLDQLFRRNAARAGEAVVLVDGPDKESWCGMAPLALPASAADQAVARLAGRFVELGLLPGDVVGLHMPNSAEAILTLLACLRAGLVPALLPLLWHDRECSAALKELEPKALVGITRAGPLRPAEALRYVGASLLSVRFVFSFGPDTPDGALSLDPYLQAGVPARDVVYEPKADDAAFITFAPTGKGFLPALRSHNHALCVGLGPLLESGLEADAEVLCTTLQPASLAGLASGFLPWLLGGGCLVLHQAFNAEVLCGQVESLGVTTLALPGPFLNQIAPVLPPVKRFLAFYSDAQRKRVPTSLPDSDVTDCVNLDEWALIALRRKGVWPLPLSCGLQFYPSTAGKGPFLSELSLSDCGHVQVRGPSTPYNGQALGGYRITSLTGKMENDVLKITGRDENVAYIGGLAADLDTVAQHMLAVPGVAGARVTPQPDPVFGNRLSAQVKLKPAADPALITGETIRSAVTAGTLAPHKVPAQVLVGDSEKHAAASEAHKLAG